MEPRVEYWAKRWEAEDSPWHKTDVNKFLQSNFERMSQVKEGPCRIFVPLCGKSLDLKWYAHFGKTVYLKINQHFTIY